MFYSDIINVSLHLFHAIFIKALKKNNKCRYSLLVIGTYLSQLLCQPPGCSNVDTIGIGRAVSNAKNHTTNIIHFAYLKKYQRKFV